MNACEWMADFSSDALSDLLSDLASKNIKLYLNDHNELKANAAKGVLTPEIVSQLKTHKGELIAMLQQTQSGTSIIQVTEITQVSKVADKAYYPLSHAQNRLWVLDQIDSGQGIYNMPAAFVLTGQLNVQWFTQALNTIVARHESLRTVFVHIDGQPQQQILPSEQCVIDFKVDDIRGHADVMARAKQLASFDATFGFDLSQGPLFKCSLTRLTDDQTLFLFNLHHIICDGWSMGVFYREVTSIYNALLNGTTVTLPELAIQYRDYAYWHNDYASTAQAQIHRDYWLKKLGGVLPVMDLPLDRPRTSMQTFVGSAVDFNLGRDLTEQLNRFAQIHQMSPFIVLHGAIKVLLNKLSGSNDIILGAVSANRNQAELENQMGFYVNTLALRDTIDADDDFTALLQKVRKTTLEAFSHQQYPFDYVVENVIETRDMSRSPLFDVMFVLQNTDIKLPQTTDLQWTELARDYDISRYDLLFYITAEKAAEKAAEKSAEKAAEKAGETAGEKAENADGLNCKLSYNTDLFDQSTIERFYGHFALLLQNLLNQPARPIGQQNLISDNDYQQLVYQFNDTQTNYPKDISLSCLFEEQVVKAPNRIALVHNGQELTYHQLNQRANQLATKLIKRGADSGVVIALVFERSFEMIISILAVLKTGSTFLPISPDYPQDRIDYMVKDSGAKFVLRHDDLSDDLSDDQDLRHHVENLNHQHSSDNIAHIIYTSGSTGKPKGVKTRQSSICRVVKDTNTVDIDADDSLLQLSNYAFDGSTFDIFGALLNGARLVLVEQKTVTDIEQLAQLIVKQNISVFFVTTALFNALVDIDLASLTQVRKILFGGEMVSVKHVKKALARLGENKLIHVYGPTESTVFATFYPVNTVDENAHTIPIGKPLANTTAFVLGEQGELLPVGVPGELYIGGDGLSTGYVNLPQMTADKFVTNPFAANSLLYRTGDWVKWWPDGNIEFIGRLDNQVKIRGHRIELGEVDALLEALPAVQAVYVTTRKTANEHHEIVAYLVGNNLDISQIHAELAEQMPSYMVPSHFVCLDCLPLNANGKVDTKNLPCPDSRHSDDKEGAASNDKEQQLCDVLCAVLGLSHIGVNQNTFHLGFDSIKAIRTVSKLREMGWRIELKELFLHPTIKELAIYLEKDDRKLTVDFSINQRQVSGKVDLSPIQQWFFARNFADSHHFNMAVMLQSSDTIDIAAIEATMDKLTQHHDALRMVYGQEGQKVGTGKAFSVQVLDDINQATELQGSMSLEEGPLVKVGLLADNHLMIAIHHLLVDGISWRILLEDFETVYAQAKAGLSLSLPAKTLSFKDWTASLADYADNMPVKEVAYWQQLSSLPITPLPQDGSSENNPSENDLFIDARQTGFELSAELTTQLLQDSHQTYNTQINDLLLSAFGLAVKDWTGADDVWINLEGHGREAVLNGAQIARTVGWFTSLYRVRLAFDATQSLGDQIRQIKENLRQVPNKGVGYGILKYTLKHPLKRNSLKQNSQASLAIEPQISFNYHGSLCESNRNVESSQTQFSRSDLSTGLSFGANCQRINPLDVVGSIKGGCLGFELHYNHKTFNAETMQGLAMGFKSHLLAIIGHCCGSEEVVLTPSDFGDDLLSIEELDAIGDALFDL